MGIFFTHKSGGPCWSRDLGYHTPTPMPRHILQIITAPTPTKSAKRKPKKK